VNTNSTLAPDAAMVLGIASTAMPFARTREAQAERWLRLLRQHGEAGVALQALGVSDDAQQDAEDDRADGGVDAEADPEGDVVAGVSDCAAQIALRRGAACVSTVDVLVAVIHVYGAAFDRVLRAHGADSDTVLVLLDAQVHEPAAS
jgi:hypothetical protein